MWSLFIIFISLGLLMYTAYRGFSVIIMAPLCALLAILLINPTNVLPFYSGIFMPKMVSFIKDYFIIFLLGALFGKIVEISGIADTISRTIIKILGSGKEILTIVILGIILTYSGVSAFVVVFAIFPFAKQLFQIANIPKKLIPGSIALGAFTFTLDALPGTPQIQNVIPSTFFGTNIYAAPFLGIIGAIFILILGLFYLEWRKAVYKRKGEGYFESENKNSNEIQNQSLNQNCAKLSTLRQVSAFIPLILVGVMNKFLSTQIYEWYPHGFDFTALGLSNYTVDIKKVGTIWAVSLALVVGIIAAIIFDYKRVFNNLNNDINTCVGGALLAIINTASEYGFGAIISILPGFTIISHALSSTFTNPLINGAITTTTLAGITGSASGGMSIVLSAMANQYNAAILAAEIPPEVMHRVIAMAAGGMDTLPHNGAVITLLAITGLTHKQAYKDIFAITIIKTSAVFVVISAFTFFNIV